MNGVPFISSKLFEDVQKVLAHRERPRTRKAKHDFPFVGTFVCGECGSMFTAQWATGRHGGRYRYYRCTKKKGQCSQGYVREEHLAEQIKERLKTISLCDAYTDYMLEKIEVLQQEDKSASQCSLENLLNRIKANEERLETLVESFLDGDIPKELYLKKKDSIMRSTLALKEKKKDFQDQGNNWVEPLREWILDTKQAAFLSESDDYQEIKLFVQKIGTNPSVRDKSARLRFAPPSDFIAARQAVLSPFVLRRRRGDSLTSEEVSVCEGRGIRTTEPRTL